MTRRSLPLALVLVSCGGPVHPEAPGRPAPAPSAPPLAPGEPASGGLATGDLASRSPGASEPAASSVPGPGAAPGAAGSVPGATSASVPAPPAPVMTTVPLPGGGEAAFVGPATPGATRLTVYLHGMCATGPLECPVFAGAASSSWLLCPDGPARCDGFGALWSGQPATVEKRIDGAAAALAARAGVTLTEPRALVGYSLGAPSALVQVLRQPGRYDRLMLVNASVEPSAAQLQKAGVTRLALVSGERDATAGKLRAAAGRLARAGLDARFFALPATGHYFDAASAGRMAVPLAWLLGP